MADDLLPEDKPEKRPQCDLPHTSLPSTNNPARRTLTAPTAGDEPRERDCPLTRVFCDGIGTHARAPSP